MLQYDPLQSLPTAEDLPDRDGKPVDNELQIHVASLLVSYANAQTGFGGSTWEPTTRCKNLRS